LRDKKAKIVI
jgi:hypothetical protein